MQSITHTVRYFSKKPIPVFSLLFFKTHLQLPVIVLYAFIAFVVEEEAVWETVGVFMFHDTLTAFSMIGAGRFRTDTLFDIWTIHMILTPKVMVSVMPIPTIKKIAPVMRCAHTSNTDSL